MNRHNTAPGMPATVPVYNYIENIPRTIPVISGRDELKPQLSSLHIHEGVEMCTVVSGAAVLHYNGRQYPMDRGDCAFFDALIPHWSAQRGKAPAIHVYVHLPLRVLWSVLPSRDDWRLFQPLIAVRSGVSPVLKNVPDLTADLCSVQAAVCGHAANNDLIAWAGTVSALIRVAAQPWPSFPSALSPASIRAGEITAQAIQFIDAHFRSRASQADIARHCNVSGSHLTHIFSKHMGITPVQYRTQARIAWAIQRLSTTQEKLQHIAGDCGYSSLSQFRDAFIKATGRTPGSFRSRADSV